MKIKLLIIGQEILNGVIQDANSKFVANFFYEQYSHSIEVIQTVPDDIDRINLTLTSLWDNDTLILVSGGLGPTEDDLTKIALNRFTNSELKPSDECISLVKNQYQRINREWNTNTNSYHLIPNNMNPLENPVGLAPGLAFLDKKMNSSIICMPGVPRELCAMTEGPVTSYLQSNDLLHPKLVNKLVVKTYGIPEEKLFKELCPKLWNDLSEYGQVSSLPQYYGVDIRLTYSNKTDYPKIRNLIIDSGLRNQIWSMEDISYTERLLNILKSQKLTIATAESCTGGLIASQITDISGSSEVFNGSVVAYSNDVKSSVLNVDHELIKSHGAVSEEVAREMAKGVAKITHSDIAISTTGIAGPLGGTEDKPVGTVCVGLSVKGEISTYKFHLRGNRELLKKRFSAISQITLLKNLTSDY